MASRTLAGSLGLKGDWDLGEDGWKDENDLNLLMLSVLVQGRVKSKVAATPGAPAEGDVHIFSADHPTNPTQIAVYDEGAWKYITPLEGWMIYNEEQAYYEIFDGTVWTAAATPAVVSTVAGAANNLLAADASKYLRFTHAAAAKTLTVQPNATEALPDNGEWHIRNAAAETLTLVAGSGVTINPPSGGTLVLDPQMTVTLKRVAVDTFDLLGQTVPA